MGVLKQTLGFDLSTMADGLYDEAIVDVIGPDALVSEPYVIKVCAQKFQLNSFIDT